MDTKSLPGTITAKDPEDSSSNWAMAETIGEPSRGVIGAPPNFKEISAAVGDPNQRYEKREQLGAGGMGEVGLVDDRWIGRGVAKKTLKPRSGRAEAARSRFLLEMRVQGQLEHPAVVPVYDLGSDAEGQLYFTMRRVQGQTLERIIEGLARGDAELTARYSRRKLLTALSTVCLALHYAHTRGVLHRDVKPANIMLGQFGEVYLLDWGVAKLVDGATISTDHALPEGSAPGVIVGTPAYMGPEQILGRADELDPRADVYSLGVVLYEVLALQPLHRGRNLWQITQAVSEGLNARPSTVLPDVAPELDAICERACQRDREARFRSALEMADAIDRFLDGDRDLERRRAVAKEHADRALAATARAMEEQKKGGDTEAARAEAMRESMRALTLDPDQKQAARSLVQLLVDVPDRMPVGVEREIDEVGAGLRKRTARMGFFSFLSILLFLPAGIYCGVRSWPPFLAGFAFVALCAALCGFLAARPRVGSRALTLLAFMNAGMLAFLSSWLGPFVVVPATAATSTIFLGSSANRRERMSILLLNSAAVLIPFALELLHVVPPSMVFENGALMLLPRAINLPRAATLIALAYTTIALTTMPTLLLGRVRDALAVAERKLFLHAWHLRRLLTDVEGKPVAKT
jgi:serine/threonine-protein kinase